MATQSAVRDPFAAQRSDDELVELARRTGNDEGAYEELYRRHEAAARNVARHILRSRQDADDVVNEAFAGVIAAINNGAGPRSNFRQYLMACVRNSCKARRWCGTSVSTDPSVMEQNGVVFEDPDRLSEQGLVASAFSSLSPDWQLTLWLTAVEERPTAEVAAQLGRRPNAVAALAHRAREAFAEAYLAQHQARNTSPACVKITAKLPHYVRGNCGDVDTVLVERHLVNCVPCSCAVDELRDLNASLRTLTGPGPLAGAGAAAVGAGAAMMAGFVPAAGSIGGWSLGAIGAGSLVKAAVVGALLIPAAALVTTDTSPSPTSGAMRAVAASAAGTRTVSGEPSSADAATAGGGVSIIDPANQPPLAAGVNGANVVGKAAGAAGSLVGALSDSVPSNGAGAVSTVSTLLGTPPLGENVPIPVTVSVTPTNSGVAVGVSGTLPAGGGANVGVAVGSSGIGVNVDATVPILTVPLSVDLSVPLSTPALAIPGVSTPAVTTPPLSTPTLAVPDLGLGLPQVTVPSVSIPSVTLVPSVSVSGTTVPGLTVPPLTVPPLSVPPLVLPTLTIPSLFG